MAVAPGSLVRPSRAALSCGAALSSRAGLSCREACSLRAALPGPVPQSGSSLPGRVSLPARASLPARVPLTGRASLPARASRSGSVSRPGRIRNTSGRVAWPARLLTPFARWPPLARRTRHGRAVVLIEGRTDHPQQLHEQPLQLTVRGSLVRHTTVVPHNCHSGTVATVTVAPYNSVRTVPRVSRVRIGHHMRFAYRIRSAA